MTSYRPSYIIVVQEKSDVMNEIMEYVYCLIYIAGIAFCVIRVNNDVKWNIRTVLLIIDTAISICLLPIILMYLISCF